MLYDIGFTLAKRTIKHAFSMFYLANRFYVAVRLLSNRSQMTLKCGKSKKVEHEAIAECVTDILIPPFDVFCDLLLNRRTATWNLIVLYNNETNYYT